MSRTHLCFQLPGEVHSSHSNPDSHPLKRQSLTSKPPLVNPPRVYGIWFGCSVQCAQRTQNVPGKKMQQKRNTMQQIKIHENQFRISLGCTLSCWKRLSERTNLPPPGNHSYYATTSGGWGPCGTTHPKAQPPLGGSSPCLPKEPTRAGGG